MRRVATLALAACLLLAGTAAADRTVGAASNGRTIHLRVGERLTIRLSECQDCGYRWLTVRQPARSVARQVSSRFVKPDLQPGEVGGSGMRVIIYRARGAGSTSLRLGYRSPAGQVSKTYRLRLVVR